MMRNINRRAVTLTEVLIAIFLMGIGLMAILSLFPLGAAQMAQALQDQRAAEAATTAAGIARVVWKQACDADVNDAQSKFYATDGSNSPQSVQPFVMAMDNPNQGTSVPITSMQAIPRAGASGVAPAATPSPTGPSYPVLLDPIGWQTNAAVSSAAQSWLAYLGTGSPTPCIPRAPLYIWQPPPTNAWVSLNTMGTLPMLKQFSLMDDMTFNFNGTPDLNGDVSQSDTAMAASSQPPPVRRQGRYSWAFLFRRKNNADRTAVDITTILYSGRSLDVASQETMYTGTGAVGSKSLTLAYNPPTIPKPAIRRGGWVLDATLGNDDTGKPSPQGIFYRVVNVDDSLTNYLTLELQTPLLGGPSTSVRSIVVMDKVVEVFTKKDVSNVAPPMPY